MESQERRRISLCVWNQYRTANLSVTPELLGATHKFKYQNREVVVSIPPLDEYKPGKVPELSSNGQLHVDTWEASNGEQVPAEYIVRSVEIRVMTDKSVEAASRIMEAHPNAYDLLPVPTQRHLDSILKEYGPIVRGAFDLWSRTIRWQRLQWNLCHHEPSDPETGWGLTLLESRSGHRVWLSPAIASFVIRQPVDTIVWERARASLVSSETPPVFIELLFDAIAHARQGDYDRATSDCAVAAETFIRSVVQDHLPSGTSEAVREIIDLANIAKVRDHAFEDCLDSEQLARYKRIKSRLAELGMKRNQILHSGRASELNLAAVTRYFEATAQLITLTGVHSLIPAAELEPESFLGSARDKDS